MIENESKEVFRYHEETKHHFHRYARSLGYMDWKNQPNPFRNYMGCSQIPLPIEVKDPSIPYSDMYLSQEQEAEPLNFHRLSGFLALSLGLSAWKMAGASKWVLRMNPSSGNLHPTEAHLILPPILGNDAGIFHYFSLTHALERRATLLDSLWNQLITQTGGDVFFIGLTSIFQRESWKYGERAFRYCQLDIGHALAGLTLAANLFGWRLTLLDCLSDTEVETLFGLNKVNWRQEDREHPDLLCIVSSRGQTVPNPDFSEGILKAFSDLEFNGTPNQLSDSPHVWEMIEQVARHSRKPSTVPSCGTPSKSLVPGSACLTVPAAQVIRQRRSAVNYDGKSVFPKDRFFSLLSQTVPRHNNPPFDVGLSGPFIHLLLFVHRVKGLLPGLYFFPRSADELFRFKSAFSPAFLWRQVEENFPLFLLSEGEVVLNAIEVSCHQEIAGFSCFSLGMISDFRQTVEAAPYRYRHLHWEAGMIGQVLYLEAEANGFRGTGIGCFFDDAVHNLLGLTDNIFQTLYHFTIGTPVEDERLTTSPPYYHLPHKRTSP